MLSLAPTGTEVTAAAAAPAQPCPPLADVEVPLLAGPSTTLAAIKAAQHNHAAVLKADALSKPAIPAAMRTIAAQWAAWLKKQHTTGGTNATPDYANPEQMNRYDWYVTSGWTKPYPGDSKIYAPSKVPGVYLASSDTEG